MIQSSTSGEYRPLANASEREAFDEMARDEARHGKAFAGLLKRYFGA